jgi:hypothetical protein
VELLSTTIISTGYVEFSNEEQFFSIQNFPLQVTIITKTFFSMAYALL